MTNVVPQPNDVVSTIREQHAQARQLIGTIKAAAPDARANPFGELAGMLHAHETAEQSVVYPAIRELGEEGERFPLGLVLGEGNGEPPKHLQRFLVERLGVRGLPLKAV